MLGWLISYTLASMAGAFIVVRIFDYIFSGVANRVTRLGLFVGTWTAITVGSGIRSFTKRMRQLRQHTRDVQ